MLRIHHGWLVAMLAVSALSLVTGCKKDEKSSATGVNAEKSGDSAGAADDLSLLPVDSEVVVGINVAQIVQSPLYKQFVEPARAKRKLGAFDELMAKCGYDPTASLKTVSLGLKGFDAGAPDGVAVFRGVEKAKSLACLDKMKEEMAKEGAEVSKDGDVTLIKGKNGETTAVSFINDTTAIMVVGKNANAAGVKSVMAGDSALKSSPTFVAMHSKVKTGDSIWFLLNGKVLDKAAMIGARPKALFGSINATDGITVDTKMQLETAEAAAQMATSLKDKAQMGAAYVDKLDFGNDGDLVTISVVVSNQKLQALVTQFGAFLGLGGAMGGQ
jgi:hypothetical protein